MCVLGRHAPAYDKKESSCYALITVRNAARAEGVVHFSVRKPLFARGC